MIMLYDSTVGERKGMDRFYWVIEESLAGCSLPGGTGPRGDEINGPAVVARDLADLRRRGIGALLTLTETFLPPDALVGAGIVNLHLPIPDMHAPQPEQFTEALHFIDWQIAAGRPVAVHCKMGQGRTGSILAAYLIRNGRDPAEAIGDIRRRCDGAIAASEQEQALHAFAARQSWII
jgi:atypical dual specificity phosphatase